MAFAYRTAKTLYRLLVPRKMNSFVFGGQSTFSRAVLRGKAKLERFADHNALYDRKYFLRQEGEMRISGRAIAESLKEKLDPKSVVDVGCGSGAILSELRNLGIACMGLEFADAALHLCREKGLEVKKFDLEREVQFDQTADVALSTEVAEHLPASVADRYVDLLCGIGQVIVMTAAVPGQGGTDHVNEQPNEYWIGKFAARGFLHERQRDNEWRADWRRRSVDHHRSGNVMVFGPPIIAKRDRARRS